MKYNGKVENIYSGVEGKKKFPIKKGYSLGTVFKFNPSKPNTYELLNFGYCPSEGKFYLNNNVNLPKEIVKGVEKMPISKETKEFLLDIGLYDYEELYLLLTQYDKAIENAEFVKRKILNLKQTLKKEDK